MPTNVRFLSFIFYDICFVHVLIQETKEQWNIVFYVTAGVQVICFVGYCTLSSGELQPWAKMGECRLLCISSTDADGRKMYGLSYDTISTDGSG